MTDRSPQGPPVAADKACEHTPPARLPARPQPQVTIIGVGNTSRGDDGVGVWVARRIAAAGWAGVSAVALDGSDGTALLSAWQQADIALVVDAAVGELPPGTVVRLDAQWDQRPAAIRPYSSHGVGMAEAIALGHALGMLPRRLIVYGILGSNFEWGTGLSTEVEQAAERLIPRLRRVISRWRQRHA